MEPLHVAQMEQNQNQLYPAFESAINQDKTAKPQIYGFSSSSINVEKFFFFFQFQISFLNKTVRGKRENNKYESIKTRKASIQPRS